VKRLQTRLTVDAGQPFYRPLDEMYSLVLSAALDPNECTSDEICMTKRILGTIIAIREPLRLSDIAKLLVIPPNEIWGNTDRIRAVVNLPPSGEDGMVSTFHASFRLPDNVGTCTRKDEDNSIYCPSGSGKRLPEDDEHGLAFRHSQLHDFISAQLRADARSHTCFTEVCQSSLGSSHGSSGRCKVSTTTS